MKIVLTSAEDTRRLGRLLGGVLQPGALVALIGDLGAGKTTLAKGAIALQGGADEDDVVSPTFVLAREYPGRVDVLHLDAYRLGGAGELESIGYDLSRQATWAVLIEWADRVEAELPEDRLVVLTTRHRNPGQPVISSDGEVLEAAAAAFDPAQMPEGARMITIDDPAQLQEILDQLGVDGDSVQMMTTEVRSGPPPKKDED